MTDGRAAAPLSAGWVARTGTAYDWLTSTDGALHWVESSPGLGRATVMGWRPSRGARLSGPPDVSVGNVLHAYGGMPYAILPSFGVVVTDEATSQLACSAIRTDTAHVYGDLAQFGDELLCVREDHTSDQLVRFDLLRGDARVLRATDGFLASPRLDLGGRRLAWVEWNRDVMPWDSSEVWTASYTPGGQIGEPVRVAGGPAESALQPQWGDDGSLYFMSDRTGWWNLYRWRAGSTEPVLEIAADCAAAPWESGYSNYVLLPGGRVGMTVQEGPMHALVVVGPSDAPQRIDVPYTSIKPYLAPLGDRVAFIGGSPTRAPEVALAATDGSGRVDVVRRSNAPAATTPSAPELMAVRSGDARITAILYPPLNGAGPAPLIVRPHAGPTHHSDLRLDWEVQFFTSRGFAVVDVDYRGSTGYGRAFRKALDGRWGSVDVEDCRNVAVHLLTAGRALPGAVFISGASAGGYTALRAACQDGPFRLAVARSAIVDPARWALTGPRFQRPHAAVLGHRDAAVTPDRVRAQVLLIHGDNDDVAPIADVGALADALRRRDLLAGFLRLEGVGHSLSGTAQAAALEAELNAYRAVLTRAGRSVPH